MTDAQDTTEIDSNEKIGFKQSRIILYFNGHPLSQKANRIFELEEFREEITKDVGIAWLAQERELGKEIKIEPMEAAKTVFNIVGGENVIAIPDALTRKIFAQAAGAFLKSAASKLPVSEGTFNESRAKSVLTPTTYADNFSMALRNLSFKYDGSVVTDMLK